MSSHRIFMGLSDVAGYYSRLKHGFDELGIDCDLYTIGTHIFNYQIKNENIVTKLFRSVSGKFREFSKKDNFFLKHIGRTCEKLIVSVLFVFCLFRYNVFIIGSKKCFYPDFAFLDLLLLKLLNKELIFVFHGTDARPPYISGSFLSKRRNDLDTIIKHAKRQKRDIKKIERYADIIINHPPSAHFHERVIVSYLHIGIPIEKKFVSSRNYLSSEDVVVIVHSPSNPIVKGTKEIREAILILKQKGYKIEFIEIINKPNKVVMETLKRCDFVVDQVYSTNPMPGFVTEAASFGKPAVICGYYFDQIESLLPPDKIPPSHYCHPDDLITAIEKMVIDKEYRLELGEKARKFVVSNWSPNKVANRFLQLIEGNIPKVWLYNPMNIRYVHGACLSERKAVQIIKALLSERGKEALSLSDKPELEKLFVDFVNSKNPS